MKTTIEIADPLLTEAKQLAARDRTTLRALVEEGLRQIVIERNRASRFRLREASFRGQGLRPEIREGGWEAIKRPTKMTPRSTRTAFSTVTQR